MKHNKIKGETSWQRNLLESSLFKAFEDCTEEKGYREYFGTRRA